MRYTWGKGDVVLTGDEPIASAHRAWVRERAEVTIREVEWLFRADGRDRVAESQGQVRIRARQRSIWSPGTSRRSARCAAPRCGPTVPS